MKTRIINRNELYRQFVSEWKNFQPIYLINMIFKSMSDEDIAKSYGLRVMRRGMFY